MAEREREQVVVWVEYVCDECKRGTMVFSEHQDRGYDSYNIHICTECDNVEYFEPDVKYPRRRYHFKDDEKDVITDDTLGGQQEIST
jgi:ssDNA-binding Zn-finger/Zn-ribbon topoisomerase 1